MGDEGTPLPRDFSRVVLTLENVLLDEEKLRVSPSMVDGIKKEDEIDLRILGCELIQTAGILMKIKQTAMATGQVVFHRFYYSKSFVKHNYEILAMACINLASKIEECPRRIRDVLNVFHHIKQVRGKRAIKPLVLDTQYILMKNQVIKAERRLLKELGFCVHVKHPHKIIVAYLQILELVDNRNVIQYAWNLMNDCLRTDVFVRYTPEAIACACIYLATRKCKIALPVKPPWYALFGVDLESIETICKMILHLYSRPKPDQERLEKLCEEYRLQQLEEKKRKAKVGMHSLDGTPNSASRTNSPKVGASPSVMLGKKIKTEDDSHLVENGSSEEKNGQKGKRRLDDSEGSHSARSGSHTRSRSSRSHSRSLSPPAKKKKRSYSPVHRHKKDRYDDYEDYYYKEKRSHKRKKRARSRSLSQSPIPRYTTSKVSKKYSKEKHRSYSPQEKVHRSRKHRNGQRDLSPRYDKYRR